MSIQCRGKRRCQPGTECSVEWKLGDGTSNTIRETKRIAIDKDGKFILVISPYNKLLICSTAIYLSETHSCVYFS